MSSSFGKDRTKEEKLNIVSVRKYFEDEQDRFQTVFKEDGFITRETCPVKFNRVTERTANALKTSRSTVKRVLAENKENGDVNPPKKSNSGRHKIKIDSFNEGVIRRLVMQSYANHEYPTLDKIHATLSEDTNFPKMQKITLFNIMKRQLQFKFGNYHGKPVPFERDDISAERHRYLAFVRKYRREGYKIFYTDETWCNSSHAVKAGWHIPEKEILSNNANQLLRVDFWLRGVGKRFTDGMIGGISSVPSGAGQRVIILDIGSEDGFLDGCRRCFIGKKDSSDYHREMNSAHFKEWMKEVLDKIPTKSVIVLDQASYHREGTPETRNPTTNWLKQQVIDWLVKQEIPVPEPFSEFKEMTVPLLREVAKKHFLKKEFIVEEMVKNCDKDVKLLWLPVAHCELNAIELVWVFLKGRVAKLNKTFKIKDVLSLCQEELKNITSDLWGECVRHVIDLENKITEKENIAEAFLTRTRPSIVITAEDLDYSTSESESETSDGEETAN